MPQAALTLQHHQSMTSPAGAIDSTRIIYSYHESANGPIVLYKAKSCMIMRFSQEFSTCGSFHETVPSVKRWLQNCQPHLSPLSCRQCLHQAKQRDPCVETHAFLLLIVGPSVDLLSPPPSLARITSETQDCSILNTSLLITFKRPWRIRTTPSFSFTHLAGQDLSLIDSTYRSTSAGHFASLGLLTGRRPWTAWRMRLVSNEQLSIMKKV